MQSDPLGDPNGKAAEVVRTTRTRKGLKPEVPPLDYYYDKRMSLLLVLFPSCVRLGNRSLSVVQQGFALASTSWCDYSLAPFALVSVGRSP